MSTRGTIAEARAYLAAASTAANDSVRGFYLARCRAAVIDAKRDLGQIELHLAAVEREAARLAEVER